jgi:periplasmic protein TonB
MQSALPQQPSASTTPIEVELPSRPSMAFTAPLFGPVLDLGDRAMRVGTAFGLLVALLFHGYASARAFTALFDMAHWARDTRVEIREYLWAVYEVDDAPKPEQPKEEPQPEPEPEPPPPEPEPQPTLAPPPPDDPYQEPPKAAAPLPPRRWTR